MGHAYEAIASDALARFKRLEGFDVLFCTGTDDHGQKMFRAAKEAGCTAREMADRLTPRFKAMCEALNISHDIFIRTSEERHHQAVQDIWRRMEKAGDIYKGNYAGWYSVRDEEFYTEQEIEENEKGEKVSPSGTPVEWFEEESYFFRLSGYQEKLLKHHRDNPHFLAPASRRNEVMRFLEGGLRDLSISRSSFDWGVAAPGDDKHIVYVWLDALTNYLTATGYPDEETRYWPADLHIIGKDIVRFHTVYWPAFLISAGLPLPKRVFGHGMVLADGGEKMSKSLGNTADPFEMVEIYGVDPLRYFFLSEIPFGEDGTYSHEAVVRRANSDLANDLGNLAQRALTMVARLEGGALSKPSPIDGAMKETLSRLDNLLESLSKDMAEQRVDKMIFKIFTYVRDANRHFAKEKPWALAKSDPKRQMMVLYATLEILRQIGILLQPVMPQSCERLLDQLNIPKEERAFAYLGEKGRLRGETAIKDPKPIFPRISAQKGEGR